MKKPNNSQGGLHGWTFLGKEHPVANQVCEVCGFTKYFNHAEKRIMYLKDSKLTKKLPPCNYNI